MSDYDARLARIHDFLYANGSSRVGTSIAREFGLIVTALAHAPSTRQGPVSLDPLTRQRILDADPQACSSVAASVRDALSRYRSKSRTSPNTMVIESSDLCVARVVAELDGVDLLNNSRDWIGDALEKFRSLEAKRLGGQFFTDQRVTELAMDLLNFTDESECLVDICAGTGGFLLAAARRCQNLKGSGPRLIGVEIDEELVNAGKRSLGHYSDNVQIARADSLHEVASWPKLPGLQAREGQVSLLASNPPFGTKIRVVDRALLARFNLAHTWTKTAQGDWRLSATTKPTSPDILFIERNVQLARPGGLIALVLPYQILSGPQLEYVREWMLRNTYVRAVIDCPSETFQPWTGTKTSLVLLEKRQEVLPSSSEIEDYEIFMAVGTRIGHDRRGKPIFDSRGELDTDFPQIGSAYRHFRDGRRDLSSIHSDSFVVLSSSIIGHEQRRINASSYTRRTDETRSEIEALASRRGWRLSTIGAETVDVFFPNRFKRNYIEASDSGAIPFVGGSQILAVEPNDGKFVHRDDPLIQSCVVQAGWVLVTRSGSTGVVSSVPDNWQGFAVSEHVIRIVPREGGLPSGYIESFLSSPWGQVLIASGVYGSVIDEITPEHLASIPIPVPTTAATKKKVQAIDTAINLVRTHRAEASAALHTSRLLTKKALN